MNETRMKKYDISNEKEKKRTEKHKNLYEKLADNNVEYVDINNAINIDDIDKQNLKRSSYQTLKEFDMTYKNKKEVKEVKLNEKRVYDINEILKEAREKENKQDDKKRILNTEYNILTKLDVEKINSSKDFSKENLKDLINTIYEKEGINPKPKKETAKKEKELLEDLLVTNYQLDETTSKEILEEIETKEVETKEVEKIEKSKTDKEEKEDYSSQELKELIKDEDETSDFSDLRETGGKAKITIIVVLVLLIIAVGVYLFLKYYGTI